MDQFDATPFRDLRPGELAELRQAERARAALARVEPRQRGLPLWWRASPRLSAGAAGLVLLALLLPSWLVDAINLRQLRSIELAASMDPSLFRTVGTWSFTLRATLSWLGVALAGVAWRDSSRRRATDYVAPPTVVIGVVVASLSTWLAVLG